MSYAPTPPAPAPNKALYAAVAAIGVIMVITLTALAAVFFIGGGTEAGAANGATTTTTIATAPQDAQQAPAAQQFASQPAANPAEAAENIEQAPAPPAPPTETGETGETAEQAPADPAAPNPSDQTNATPPAEPASNQPTQTPSGESAVYDVPPAETNAAVPSAPAPAAPVVVHPTCTTSKHSVVVGETFVITGTHSPHYVPIEWAFDHGDGTLDRRNPSHAYYAHPGTYDVTGLAETSNGYIHYVHCGTVTVSPAHHPEFHCSIDDTYIPVLGHTVFRATSNVDDHTVEYTFDHGDGYREVANPSYATYYYPGEYHVSVAAFYNGVTTHVDCGTVTVFAEEPVECPTHSVIGLNEWAAIDVIENANCTAVVVVRDLEAFPITTDYRTDRVQLTVLFGIVTGASIG